jgi:hypothetical protein
LLDRRREELVGLDDSDGELALRFADGGVERVQLVRALSRDERGAIHAIWDPGREHAVAVRRSIGVVTERVCCACTGGCRCRVPMPVPAALAGQVLLFRPDRSEPEQRIAVEAIGGISTAAVRRIDVVEIAFLDLVREPQITIVRLRDDRWAYLSRLVRVFDVPNFHSDVDDPHDLIERGYLIEASSTVRRIVVAATLEELWRSACSDADRGRLARLPAGLDEELVRLDAMLQSADAEQRAFAEARMLQIHLARGR